MIENLAASTTRSSRIAALDGLRGLAILFVFINHLRLQPLIDATPEWFSPLWAFLSANGKAGVCLFFVLSGYWAITLYRQLPNPWRFLQRRYARIFPPLLVMCLALSVIRFFWLELSPWLVPLIVLSTAWGFSVVKQIWTRTAISRTSLLFGAFVTLQALVGAYYLFVLPQTPPAVFYQVWAGWLRQVVVFLVNATMTLPLGRYIGQLDGAYWALTVEVAFYLLYPWIILPFFKLCSEHRAWWFKILSGLLVYPFIAGLALIFQHVLGFSIFTVHLFIFVIAGMVLGELNARVPSLIKKVLPPENLRSGWVVGIGLLLLFGRVWVYPLLPENTYWVLDMVWTIPVIVGVIWILYSPAFHNFFSQRWLVTLGSYSYLIYLTHTIAIEMFMKGGEPQTLVGALVKISGAILITGLLSEALYRWVERRSPAPTPVARPVAWSFPKLRSDTYQFLSSLITKLYPYSLPARVLLVGLAIVGGAWLGYRSPVSLFQPLQVHTDATLPSRLIITDQPQAITFTAAQDNLGMVLLHLTNIQLNGITPSDAASSPTRLQVKILDENTQALSTAEFQVMEIGDSRFHPIGLPIQSDSAHQPFTIELTAINPKPDQTVVVNNNETILRSVYFPVKSELIRQPQRLATLLWSQLTEPFITSSSARWSVLLTTPLMLLLAWLSIGRSRSAA